jgi:hypothetical protein
MKLIYQLNQLILVINQSERFAHEYHDRMINSVKDEVRYSVNQVEDMELIVLFSSPIFDHAK